MQIVAKADGHIYFVWLCEYDVPDWAYEVGYGCCYSGYFNAVELRMLEQ